VVTEIALLRAKPGRRDQLRDGLRAARSVIAQAPGYRGSAFYQGVEDPDAFVLVIQWGSLEDHLEGFRKGPLFAEWRRHFAEHAEGPPQVSHFETIAV
jgi:heme-degrading monooxygenase HmoA